MLKKDILRKLEEIKKELEIINLRLDGIDNDIHSMKTWMIGFDSTIAMGADKPVQKTRDAIGKAGE